MKARRLIAGVTALACTMALGSSFVSAADVVKVSVSEETAAAGESFTLDVDFENIPSAGIGIVDFAIQYDASLVTIDNVATGSLCNTGAADAENNLVSGLGDTVFDWYDNDGEIAVLWVTGLEDSNYLLQGSGCFVTISGTVNDDAAKGSVAQFKIVPVTRETYTGSGVTNSTVGIGYVSGDGTKVNYDTQLVDGSVTVAGSSSSGASLGDVNCDGAVNLSDIITGNKVLADEVQLSDQGMLNGDVDFDNTFASSDVAKIQKYLSGAISYAELCAG